MPPRLVTQVRAWRRKEKGAQTGHPKTLSTKEKNLCASGRSDWGSLGNSILLLAVGLLTRFADVDPAFEERTVFNADARSHDIASERSIVANINPIASGQVAANLAQHHDLARVDVSGNHAV